MKKEQLYIAALIVGVIGLAIGSMVNGFVGALIVGAGGGAVFKLLSAATGPESMNKDSFLVSWAQRAKEEFEKMRAEEPAE